MRLSTHKRSEHQRLRRLGAAASPFRLSRHALVQTSCLRLYDGCVWPGPAEGQEIYKHALFIVLVFDLYLSAAKLAAKYLVAKGKKK